MKNSMIDNHDLKGGSTNYSSTLPFSNKISTHTTISNSSEVQKIYPESLGQFKQTIGELPIFEPNIRSGYEELDLANLINQGELDPTGWCLPISCALTGIGACYVYNKQFLVSKGEYGFSINNGVPQIYFPGRHAILSPLNEFKGVYNAGSNLIKVGPISIVRIPVGSVGLALSNSLVEILLPGVHCRNNATFMFQRVERLSSDFIDFGPIKMFIVRSGGVRVCYVNGRVTIFSEGRYAVNSTSFSMAQLVVTQQQNHRFTGHKVMLSGGIRMIVEGLLTYQVTDVEQLIHQLGENDLLRAIESVTEAELSRIFASVHLEKISASSLKKENTTSIIGGESLDSAEGQERAAICVKVIEAVRPMLSSWGCKVINFQLESTALADKDYAREYEAASLEMAKAQSNLRALAAQNQLLISKSRATAEAQRLEAEGQKSKSVLAATARAESVKFLAEAQIAVAQSEKEALIILVEAQSEARIIEAKARNESALEMTDKFAQKYALAGLEVDFGSSLQATHLTMMHESRN